ncbi:MAG: RNA polymerase sigma factor [Bacteroidota bacterium]
MEKGFLRIIQDNEGLLYKIINAYCDDIDDREDLYQEIIFQLWKSFPRFKGQSKISTWMYRVALNTAISNFKKGSKRKNLVSIHDFELHIGEEHNHEEEERLKIFYQALKQLTKIERAVIMLFMDGKSYEEMAEILGLTTSNIGVKLNRTKNKLKEMLKDY